MLISNSFNKVTFSKGSLKTMRAVFLSFERLHHNSVDNALGYCFYRSPVSYTAEDQGWVTLHEKMDLHQICTAQI